MDVYCATCGEPWDSHHLLYDEVWEWDLPEAIAQNFRRNPRFSGPEDPVRMAAKQVGWEFAGASPLAILRCPGCPESEPLPDAGNRIAVTRLAAQMLAGDEDGLIVELSDLGGG
jgi:hypothetical protein